MALIPHIDLDIQDDAHLRGIGLVAVAWSYLEGAIERITWVAGRFPEKRGLAVTTHMSVPARLDAMLSMVDLAFPNSSFVQTLRNQTKHIKTTLAPLRNEIVHSRLHPIGEVGHVFRTTYRARGKVKAANPLADLQEYEDAASKILTTTNELIDILNEIVEAVTSLDGAPPPWPNRP